MDAETKMHVLNQAADRLEDGVDVITVLGEVFSSGYGYGLYQGHYDNECHPG